MGCCFSSEDDKDTLTTEPDETTRLINPVTNHSPRIICCCCCCYRSKKDELQPYTPESPRPQIQSCIPIVSDGGTNSGHVETRHHNEQSALDKILQRTARNVIDVSVESNLVEQTEYQERARQYSNRINMVVGSSRLRQKTNLPNSLIAPQSVLAGKPISLNDVQLITNAAEKAAKCIKEIKVQHKENLVVPFGVP